MHVRAGQRPAGTCRLPRVTSAGELSAAQLSGAQPVQRAAALRATRSGLRSDERRTAGTDRAGAGSPSAERATHDVSASEYPGTSRNLLSKDGCAARARSTQKFSGARFRSHAPRCTEYVAPVDNVHVPVPWYGVVMRYEQFMYVPRCP